VKRRFGIVVVTFLVDDDCCYEKTCLFNESRPRTLNQGVR